MQTIYKLNQHNIYTFESKQIEDNEGCPPGWTRTDCSNLDPSKIWQIRDNFIVELDEYPTETTPVPQYISPRQIRQSLNHFNLRTQVEAVVASGDQDLKDWWEFATSFDREHPLVLDMSNVLNITNEQLDEIWIYGASI